MRCQQQAPLGLRHADVRTEQPVTQRNSDRRYDRWVYARRLSVPERRCSTLPRRLVAFTNLGARRGRRCFGRSVRSTPTGIASPTITAVLTALEARARHGRRAAAHLPVCARSAIAENARPTQSNLLLRRRGQHSARRTNHDGLLRVGERFAGVRRNANSRTSGTPSFSSTARPRT